MNILFTRALVCDPQSAYNNKKCDILVQGGLIKEIKVSAKSPIKPKAGIKVVSADGLCMSPGFVDMRTTIGEPGFEQKETLESASEAAIRGGFTHITCLPNTLPIVQSKSDIAFILSKAAKLKTHILPIGALSNNCEGKQMNELYDMHTAGAVGFSDGNSPIHNSGLLLRSLEYTKTFPTKIFVHPHDKNLAIQNGIHEGVASTYMGCKGIPGIAEEIMIARDIELAKYAGNSIHFSHISSKGSVDLIKKAKKSGMKITCDVAVANLIWTEDALLSYDTNFKLTPPLRSKADQKALWAGLLDGTIDAIVTDHIAQDTEHKNVEFEYASEGMIQLQTAFSLILMHAPANYTLANLVQHLCIQPRNILNLPNVSLTENSAAELTLFNIKEEWAYNALSNASRSQNSPVLGTKLKGAIKMVINKNQLFQF